jgi:DNA polymerase III subunit epsilon
MLGGMEISLNLSRPLAVLDLETTGLVVETDRIVEIAILKVCEGGKSVPFVTRLNPQIPIPAAATAVHGITDEDVKHEPTFKQLAPKIAALLDGCDLAGFNIVNFDVRLLAQEFARAGVPFSLQGRAMVDAKQIYHAKERRDLEAACRFYLKRDHPNAHAALDDAQTTWCILNAQLQTYEDLPRDPAGIHALFNRSVDSEGKFEWKNGEVVFSFGKYRGQLLRDVVKQAPDYLEWISNKLDFSAEVRQIAKEALAGKFPTRKQTGSAG